MSFQISTNLSEGVFDLQNQTGSSFQETRLGINLALFDVLNDSLLESAIRETAIWLEKFFPKIIFNFPFKVVDSNLTKESLTQKVCQSCFSITIFYVSNGFIVQH